MLKISHLLISLFAVTLSLTACKNTPEPTKIVDRNAIVDSTITAFERKLLAKQIDSVFSKFNFNGSIAVFKDTLQLYQKENGFSNFQNKTKINDSTIFAIGSVSKQFTAALVLLQMEQGKLNVEDKVSKYLKEAQNKEYENITIHQLLNHTSGLNLLGGKLLFESGSDFFYSNDGFNALGKIVEQVSGKSYDENVLGLFSKIGMKNSSTGNTFKGKNFASAYLGNLKNAEKVPNMPQRLGGKEIGIPAGGILSTIDDLHLWNNSLYNGKVLKPETFQKFISKSAERHHAILGKMGYGYGIMLNIGKPIAYFHSGYVKGSPSLNIYYPETKTSVIILSNIADEAKGKGYIFRPHIEVKKITDAIENTVIDMRKQMIKPDPNKKIELS
ncbi:serine hydrolase domain-containing protein [Chryseobacterium paridis]|uniref:Beta-lactamase family protein n=1 Tax=Chryseobacterium paridis TaxID=2800328 RepID=A0ABS1G0K7_9FLAO|nr:serine hydrolase domain-containing protein [Chryseobacterium paridis]MBK1898231.1 beta-lactamase family protein [Chryseobacterium paridis]